MRPRIRTQLILAFLVTVLLPLIGTGLYGNWTTSRTLKSQTLDNAQTDLSRRALQVESLLGGARENALLLSRLDSLASFVHSAPSNGEAARALPPG